LVFTPPLPFAPSAPFEFYPSAPISFSVFLLFSSLPFLPLKELLPSIPLGVLSLSFLEPGVFICLGLFDGLESSLSFVIGDLLYDNFGLIAPLDVVISKLTGFGSFYSFCISSSLGALLSDVFSRFSAMSMSSTAIADLIFLSSA
jgi:hypothetical protein